jgi:hypothetical protein
MFYLPHFYQTYEKIFLPPSNRNEERINARILFTGSTGILACESSKPHQDSQTRMSVPLKPKEV